MSRPYNLDDTIVAISTPMGSGGIGIVRLSGLKAVAVAERMFLSKDKKRVCAYKSHTIHYGWIVRAPSLDTAQKTNAPEIIDEVLLSVMRAPRTYTREDIVEISCHGGVVALKGILTLAIEYGARLAEPGEFTKRAFLNGRIDLTQAEAVLDIIQAKTEAFLRASTHQLKGELTDELEKIRERLMAAYTQIEAVVNFPEEGIETTGRDDLAGHIRDAQKDIEGLLRSSRQGRILKDGIKVVLCGKPNVGKSSLLNVLLKQPRAIVCAIAGTTRDTIEEFVQIKGIPFQLIDTAGILDPRDAIEEEALRRSRMFVAQADIVLFLVDASTGICGEDERLISLVRERPVMAAINKCDLPRRIERKELEKVFSGRRVIEISALQKTGIDTLEEALVEQALSGEEFSQQGILVSNMRHVQALERCLVAVRRAGECFGEGVSLEFVSEEIKTAIQELDAITGRYIEEDLLERIFSSFCIGK